MKLISSSEATTRQLGKKLAQSLKGGEVISLVGELGAGKTAFVKGLAEGLKIKQKITSPTFVVMRVYPVKHPTIARFVHIDAYRVKTAAALTAIGLDDYIKAKDTVVVIEWADLVKKVLPKKILIKFKFQKPNSRLITIYE